MTSSRPTRAVIDTNALLDWLVFGDVDAVAMGAAVACGDLTWLATPRMRAELHAVLLRPLPECWETSRKHALTIDLSAVIAGCAEPVQSAAAGLACRDTSDQMFVDLALAHSPSWLITRDRALLTLRRRAALREVRVCTPAQWRQAATPA